MNLSKTNEWLSLIANIGVLVGIVFLVLELNQNTAMMQSQTRQAMTENTIDWLLAVGGNRETASAYRSQMILSSADEPDVVEAQMMFFVVQANFRIWENEYYQYQKGLFENEEFAAKRTTWATPLRFDLYKDFWNRNKGNFSSGFQREIDGILANGQ